MSRQLLRALSLVIVFALGAALAPLATAATTSTGSVKGTAAQSTPKLLKNIRRSCKASKSSKRLKTRTRKRIRSNTYRYTYVFCSGRRVVKEITNRRGRTIIKVKVFRVGFPQPGPVVTTPAPAPAPAPRRAFRLTLLHNNDGESKLRTGDSIPNYGGAARYKTRIDQLRAEADAFSDAAIATGSKVKGTVNVSSGDNFLAGITYQASLAAGKFYDALAIDAIGYDAITIGNHEFDFGPNRLADFVEDVGNGTPFISANLGFDNEPRLKALADAGRIRSSVTVERGGERVGIIGLTTPTLPTVSSPGATQIRSNLAEIVNAEVDRLQAAGVNKIVLSSHLQGIGSEKELIPMLSGVDVVIAGGGDELLINPGQPRAETAAPVAGPYPDRSTSDRNGRAVPIVTTQGEYRYVGRLVAEFDADGVLQGVDPVSNPVRVSGKTSAPADADAVAPNATLVRQIDEPVTRFRTALDSNIVSSTDVGLDGRNPSAIRQHQTNLGSLVADGFRYVVNRDAAARGLAPAQVALTNGGGIRNNNVLKGCAFPFSPPAPISEGDTFNVLPFDNVTVRVDGVSSSKLKQLLEHGYGSLPGNGGRFPQTAGMNVRVNATAPAGSKVQSVFLRNADGSDGTPLVVAGVAVPGAPEVTMATNDFTARGGDGYPFAPLTFQALSPSVGYQQALLRYLSEPTANGALGGRVASPAVSASQYPFGLQDRVVIDNNLAYPGCG